MKAAREHRIPLSDAAMAILERQAAIRVGDYVFGGRSGGPLGKNSLGRLLKQLGRPGVTVHGFRSTFRDWFPRQLIITRRLRKWRWPMLSATKSRLHTAAATCSRSGET